LTHNDFYNYRRFSAAITGCIVTEIAQGGPEFSGWRTEALPSHGAWLPVWLASFYRLPGSGHDKEE
jgi:hypothetical protein